MGFERINMVRSGKKVLYVITVTSESIDGMVAPPKSR